MSYKLVRLVLSVIGLAALGGFGWTFYDFIQNKAEYNQPVTQADMNRWSREIPPPPTRFKVHVPEWSPGFNVVHELNVTGELPPDPVEGGGDTEPPPPPPRFSPDDVTVALIIAGAEAPGAYLIPSGAEERNGIPPGDFYGVGDTLVVPAKQNAELKVVAIRDREVELATLDDADSFTVSLASAEGEGPTVVFDEAPAEAAAASGATAAPRETTEIRTDEYRIGLNDLEQLEEMQDDEIYAAVRVQPARDAVQNVRGLRITSIQSGTMFDRIGLEEDDVVLSVNGIPAVDRADLLQKLRDAPPSGVVRVEIERRGGARTLTYRVPRRP